MTLPEGDVWIWKQAGDYERRTAVEEGIYHERYHDLLDLVGQKEGSS
jgi:hypothetical protein